MSLSIDSKMELRWWLNNLPSMENWLYPPPITNTIFTDASHFAWGTFFRGQSTGGSWDIHELPLHINVKEILSVYYSLRSFSRPLSQSHVKVFSDNTTAVGAINKMGSSRSLDCHEVVRDIWEFCRSKSIWITCAHIPRIENVEADKASRKQYCDAEWMLNPEIFLDALHHHNSIIIPQR